jgi:uncharacterized protein
MEGKNRGARARAARLRNYCGPRARGSNDMLAIALLLALLIGVSLGLLGGGGSILTVPILRYVLGMEGHSAIATSLLVVGTTSLAALLAHARKGRVLWRTGFVFGGAGMLGAYLAGTVAYRVPAPLLLGAFSVMMLATAIAMLRPERRARNENQGGSRRSRRLPVSKIVLEGLAVGAITGLVGAGGGFLVVPALVLLARLPMATAIGTSLLVIALKSFAGFAGYVGHTSIDWPLALGISFFAVVGSFGGTWLAARLSARALRQGFGWFVVAMAFFILARELPPLVGFAAHLGLAAVASLAGTLLVAAVRRLASRRRSGRDGSDPEGKPAPGHPPAASLHSKLERKWS